jgi:hypothetical protein
MSPSKMYIHNDTLVDREFDLVYKAIRRTSVNNPPRDGDGETGDMVVVTGPTSNTLSINTGNAWQHIDLNALANMLKWASKIKYLEGPESSKPTSPPPFTLFGNTDTGQLELYTPWGGKWVIIG